MNQITITANDLAMVISHLTGGSTELCAILYTTQYARADGVTRLLVREYEFPSEDDYSVRGKLEAELKPEYVARVTKRAKRAGLGIVFVHSHPGDAPPVFSSIDNRGEAQLRDFLAHRHHGPMHAALVVSRGGLSARQLGKADYLTVVSLGKEREVHGSESSKIYRPDEQFDRQVRAFGDLGQKQIQKLRIAIVGLGGTGSIVAQQLAHLGVGDFILVDPDVVDASNLNRIANANAGDVGQPKVGVAQRYIKSIRPDARVASIQGDVVRHRHARELLNADLVFGCTDSHGSRAVMQQVSYQYLIPYIDVGVTIVVSERVVTHVIGRVQLLAPELSCFACGNLLDSELVRRDMMSEAERRQDPYIQGVHEPAPAVMSLNGTVASLGVTMFLSYVAHVPAPARHLLYNAITSKMRVIGSNSAADCYICSRKGGFARADSWPLNVRMD